MVIVSYKIFFCLSSGEAAMSILSKVKVIRNEEEVCFLSLSQLVWNYINSEACAVFLAREAAH